MAIKVALIQAMYIHKRDKEMVKKTISSIFSLILLITTGCRPTLPRDIAPTFQTECIAIENTLPDFNQIHGSIVSTVDMDSLAFTNSRGTRTYNVRDLIAKLLPIDESLYYEKGWFTNFLIAPNNVVYEIISYASDSTMFWVVGEIQSNGTHHTIYASIDSRNYSIVGLVDENTLLLRDEKRVDQLSLLLLDITNGAITSFSPSFSDLYSDIFWQFDSGNKRDGISYLLNRVPWYEHQFSPDKSRVFLFVSDSTGMKYILWDNERGEKIWKKNAYSPSPIAPQWTMSGENIAYVDRGDLIILTKDGKENELLLPPEKYLSVYMPFKWSPNGRYLAFWVGNSSRRNDIMQSFELAIYDMKSNKIINTCIVSEGRNGVFFWSPDGKQIVISAKNNQYILLNIQEEYSFRFHFDQGEIIGWVK